MVVTMEVTQSDLEHLSVTVALAGLDVGERYDVHRLQMRYLGDNDTEDPQYDREIPDRRALWSSVAHRVGWEAPAATATFKDFEAPMRPVVYHCVKSSQVGPYEYTDWDTPYPLSRGVTSQVVHFDRELELALSAGREEQGHVIVRSTHELGKFVSCCVVEMPELRYIARGTELAVLGSQYPVYVSDTREARRGSITLSVDSLGKYNDLRSIAFPSTGVIRPVIFNAGGDDTMLLDDMRCILLDVAVEQATHADPSQRFIHLDYVETDPSAPLVYRSGDNDVLVNEPRANFSVSDTTPAKGQWVTLSDTSTGQYDSWDWSFGGPTNNVVGKHYSQGPHRVRWSRKGKHLVKLRVYGSGAGADTVTKTITVH